MLQRSSLVERPSRQPNEVTMKELEQARLRAIAAGSKMTYILYHIKMDWERRDFKNYDRNVDTIMKYAG
jgi:hypothetical protein